MRISIPTEVAEGECRVAGTPDTVQRLVKLGYEVTVQRGAGEASQFQDEDYEAAGATLADDAASTWAQGDIVTKVNPPTDAEVAMLNEGTLLIAHLWPAQNEALIQAIADRGAHAISLDKIPRISRAQKMDVLSSQANIAGYRAVIEAAHCLPRFFAGQITAAGKTPPARVLIIGAGVAGLAALGAARGLGAEVYAFDTRSAVREQVQSLGGRFLEVQFEESGEGSGGYAKVMSKEFIEAEMALFREHAPNMDIVITTALIPGRPAPKLWLTEHVELMKRGSVVVDLAAIQGGNCDLTEAGKRVVHNGVSVLGYTDLTSRLPSHASQFFASNIAHLLDDMTGDEGFHIDLDDEAVRGALVCHAGEVLPPPPPPEPSPPPKPAEPEKQEAAPATPAAPAPAAVEAPAGNTNLVAGIGTLALAAGLSFLGQYVPGDFLQHLTVFILACFIGWQVVWNVTAALHTPLMSVTNAISGIIVVGGLLQAGSGNLNAAAVLGTIAILVASINIAGGFLVTQRMLAMFRK